LSPNERRRASRGAEYGQPSSSGVISVENRLHTRVCHHRIELLDAPSMMAHGWIAVYPQFVGPVPTTRRHRNAE